MQGAGTAVPTGHGHRRACDPGARPFDLRSDSSLEHREPDEPALCRGPALQGETTRPLPAPMLDRAYPSPARRHTSARRMRASGSLGRGTAPAVFDTCRHERSSSQAVSLSQPGRLGRHEVWLVAGGRRRAAAHRSAAGRPCPPARAPVPDGYGDGGFQASGVDFPTEGCWEVIGALPTTSLRFVAFVIKRGA
jgi:hypothetical protein